MRSYQALHLLMLFAMLPLLRHEARYAQRSGAAPPKAGYVMRDAACHYLPIWCFQRREPRFMIRCCRALLACCRESPMSAVICARSSRACLRVTAIDAIRPAVAAAELPRARALLLRRYVYCLRDLTTRLSLRYARRGSHAAASPDRYSIDTPRASARNAASDIRAEAPPLLSRIIER